jgi:isoamylase
MTSLIAQLTDLRRRFSQLRPKRWVEGRRADDSFGVLWLTPQGVEMTEKDWNFPEGRFLAYALGPLRNDEPVLYVVLNAAPQTIDFTLPELPGCSHWVAVLDTTGTLQVQKLPSGGQQQAPARAVLAFAGFP